MDFKKLHNLIVEMNLPAYREKQIRRAFFVDLASGWDGVTVLPKELREEMKKKISWDSLLPVKIVGQGAEAVKAAFALEDKEVIESVLIKHKDGPSARSGHGRRTVCVSSQVGCSLACAFCATGKAGCKRNLESHEIAEQVIYFARMLKSPHPPFNNGGKFNSKLSPGRITNVVFMGMGEPFLNYENAMKAIKILNDKEGFNLGARHISVSTCGIVSGIKKMAKEKLQINLALSLHAASDKLRGELMPINKKYNIEEVFKAVDYYIKETNRRVMIEYSLIDKINDSENDAAALSELIKPRPLCYVNLIPYNATGSFKRSTEESVKRFAEILDANKVKYTIRRSFGRSISAACGQLASTRH